MYNKTEAPFLRKEAMGGGKRSNSKTNDGQPLLMKSGFKQQMGTFGKPKPPTETKMLKTKAPKSKESNSSTIKQRSFGLSENPDQNSQYINRSQQRVQTQTHSFTEDG
jgi:hypothetical protein